MLIGYPDPLLHLIVVRGDCHGIDVVTPEEEEAPMHQEYVVEARASTQVANAAAVTEPWTPSLGIPKTYWLLFAISLRNIEGFESSIMFTDSVDEALEYAEPAATDAFFWSCTWSWVSLGRVVLL